MTQPPSFEPRSHKNRPSSQGAQEVAGSQSSSDQLKEWAAISQAAQEDKARRAERAKRAAQAAEASQAAHHAAPSNKAPLKRTPAHQRFPSPSASSSAASSQQSLAPQPMGLSPAVETKAEGGRATLPPTPPGYSSSSSEVRASARPPRTPNPAAASQSPSNSAHSSISSAKPGGSAVKIPGSSSPAPQAARTSTPGSPASIAPEHNTKRPSLFDPLPESSSKRSLSDNETQPASSSSEPSLLEQARLRKPDFSGIKRFASRPPGRPRRWKRKILLTFTIVLVALIAWPVYLIQYGNSKLGHVDALSGSADTAGTTYLIVGSDKREENGIYDPVTTGQRADTIMLLQVPESGNASLVSLPRDSYVEIPGHNYGKLNSAYSLGGAGLLVQTVENLSGLGVDHYVEVSMGGVKTLVDAVGGVNLCYEHDVEDADSGMNWTAGCHDVDGTTALAFSRMRKADPLGDIGRTARQRQVVAKVIDKAVSKSTLFSPSRQKSLVGAAADNLTTDQDSGITSLGRAGLGLRDVMKADGLMGAPPITNIAGRAKGQSVVLLDDEALPGFFAKMRDGQLTSEDFYNPLG